MKKLLHTLLFLLTINFGFSQVKDISFTLSPFADYTFWDNKAGLEDGLLYGGKLGFGFGEYIELRAIYLQSNDLKTNFDNFGLAGFDAYNYTPQKLKLTRWGGEFKANIGTGKLNPYVTIGTGVQNIEVPDAAVDFDQIYTGFGLGIKTKLTDRIIFTLEGKNTLFNFNSGKNLLTDDDKTALGVTDADFERKLTSNWSVQGSLQFYLGGRRPGTLTELDKAYLKKFRGGFRGIQWVVEPSANYVEFDDNSAFRNTWMLGGYFGIDFNRFTGIRAFYLQATENDQLSTTFDKLSMYGLEFRARLNDGNGVTPYLVLGGGYMNPESSYVGKDATLTTPLEGSEFAMAGLGLNIPLAKNFLITGGVRGIVTSGSDVENLAGPDELQTHIMYNAGLKLTFGAKSKNPDDIYNAQVDDALDAQDKIISAAYEKKLQTQKAESQEKLALLKEEYNTKMDSLNVELVKANETNDVKKAVEVLEQKKETQKSIDEVEKVTKKVSAMPAATVMPKVEVKEVIKEEEVKVVAPKKEIAPSTPQNQPKELIKMSPAELELLIDKILNHTETPQKKATPQNSSEVDQLNKRIDFLEKLIIGGNNSSTIEKKNEVVTSSPTITQKKLDELQLQMDLNAKKMDALNAIPNVTKEITIINPNASNPIFTQTDSITKKEVVVEEEKEGKFIKKETKSNLSDNLTYKGASIYTGYSFGGQTAINVGFRMNYGMKKTRIEFMPEFYYGIANPGTFGISGNLVYPFKIMKDSDLFMPYAGIGAGVNKNDGEVKLAHNLIIGGNLKFLGGRLFLDYTARNFAKINQVALGYRFNF